MTITRKKPGPKPKYTPDERRMRAIASARAYRERNAEKEAVRKAAYYWDHRDSRLEQNRAWWAENATYVSQMRSRQRLDRTQHFREHALNAGICYTLEDDQLILNADLSVAELAVRLGRSADAIVQRRRVLRHPEIKVTKSRHTRAKRTTLTSDAPRRGIPYTPEEDALLIDSARTLLELAGQLGRTYRSVESRRRLLKQKSAA